MNSKHILKKREYLGKVLRAFGGYVASYGPWQTVISADDPATLRWWSSTNREGMMQYAIFFRGRRTEWLLR